MKSPALLLLAALLFTARAGAETYFTGALSDRWEVGGNWSSGVPSGGESGYIDNGSTVRVITRENYADWIVGGDSFGGGLTVEANGFLQSYVGIFGYGPGATGSLKVSGAGSEFATTGNLYVGYDGTGSLMLEHGGKVRNSSALLGYDAGAVGTASVSGAGSTWEMSGTLTIGLFGSGALTISDGATVAGGFATTLGAFAGGSGALTLNGTAGARGLLLTGEVSKGDGSGLLTFNGGVLQAQTDSDQFVSGFASGQVTVASGGAFFDSQGFAIGLRSELSGPGALTKIGLGTLTIHTGNTYTGGTLVSAGQVEMRNTSGSAFGSGPVTVAAGATLFGGGSFSGSVQVDGTFSPGSLVGTAHTGSATWNSGGKYRWEIDSLSGAAGADPGWDLWNINGSLNIAASGAPFTLALVTFTPGQEPGLLTGFDASQARSWTVLTTSLGISGSLGNITLDTAGFKNAYTGTFSLGIAGNNLVLNYVPIPEPSAAAMALGALLVLGGRRRAGRRGLDIARGCRETGDCAASLGRGHRSNQCCQ